MVTSNLKPASAKSKKKVAVLGAPGYGGIQIIRLLKDHPSFEISYLGGNRAAGKNWKRLCPFIHLEDDPTIQPLKINFRKTMNYMNHYLKESMKTSKVLRGKLLKRLVIFINIMKIF